MAEAESTEVWRGKVTEKLSHLEQMQTHTHACVEGKHAELLEAFSALSTRITPLETLRAYILGAAYMLVALSPLLWWFVSSRILPFVEKVPVK